MASSSLLHPSPMYTGRSRSHEDNALQGQGFAPQPQSKAERARSLIRRAMELAKEAELEARVEAALVAEYGPRLKPDSKE